MAQMQTAAEERHELRVRIEAEIKDKLSDLFWAFDIELEARRPDKPEWDAIQARMRDLCEQAYLRTHSIGDE
jgi:hypothetical protein